MVLLTSSKEIQKESVQYIADNQEAVIDANQNTLRGLNVFYLIVLVGYYFASKTFFAEWGVTWFYRLAVLIQCPITLFVFFRYRNVRRSRMEVMVMCTLWQMYVMFFIGVMSVYPVEMNQPAVYYAPIGIAFVASFIFAYAQTMALAILETVVYLIVSFIFKQSEVFSVDLCSSILFMVMAVYITKILCIHRNAENEAKQRIRRMGMIDTLTSIYNKASTQFLCKEYLRNQPKEECVAMILDFDNFKTVNDTYGHQAGDVVLMKFGSILRHVAGENHIAGRIGGDEFFLFLKNCGQGEAEEIAKKIQDRTHGIHAPDTTQPFSCSIGIAVKKNFGDDGNDLESYDELFERADQALYAVKENGRNNYKFDS